MRPPRARATMRQRKLCFSAWREPRMTARSSPRAALPAWPARALGIGVSVVAPDLQGLIDSGFCAPRFEARRGEAGSGAPGGARGGRLEWNQGPEQCEGRAGDGQTLRATSPVLQYGPGCLVVQSWARPPSAAARLTYLRWRTPAD